MHPESSQQAKTLFPFLEMTNDISYWTSMSANNSNLGFTKVYTLNHSLPTLLNEKLHYNKKNAF